VILLVDPNRNASTTQCTNIPRFTTAASITNIELGLTAELTVFSIRKLTFDTLVTTITAYFLLEKLVLRLAMGGVTENMIVFCAMIESKFGDVTNIHR
jgi:hypothetical protein